MTMPVTGSTTQFLERCAPLLNVWGPFRMTRDPITETAIHRFCEVAQDANPVYWDAEYAKTTRFGRLIAPPQALFAFTFAAWWTPEYVQQRHDREVDALNGAAASAGSVHAICDEFGYTVNTVAGQEAEYLAPFGPGDGRIKMRNMTTHVTSEKTVRVGKGVFITSVTEYRTEVGDRLIGRSTLVLLCYRPKNASR